MIQHFHNGRDCNSTPDTDGRGIRIFWRAIVIWYVIWCLVGVAVLTMNWEVPLGGLSDFIFMALAALLVAQPWIRALGPARGFCVLGAVALVSAVMETIGAKTDFPFGPYHYTGRFGPQIGPLPLAIPLAWIVVLLPLITFAVYSTRKASHWLRLIVLFGGVPAGAVAVDLLLEPVAWQLRGYWLWEEPGGGYYGVPAQNFAGWFLTACLCLLAAWPWLRGRGLRSANKIGAQPMWVLASVVGVFTLTAFSADIILGGMIGAVLLLTALMAGLVLDRPNCRKLRLWGRRTGLGKDRQ
jgi:putative membrane protein